MRKALLILAVALTGIYGVKAQDVINLGVNDDIKTTLSTYTGSNVVLVIPAGYTNPQSVPTLTGTTYSWNAIDLSTLTNLTSSTKITISGDGTNPTLTLKAITLPAALSKIAFKNLTITGAVPFSTTPGNAIDPTLNYVFNQGASAATVVDSIVFDNCNISSLRSMVRFQNAVSASAPTQKANNVIINNCIVSNFADYGVIYNSSIGGYFGPIQVTKSTFYGFGATVFMLQKNSTSINITDCTFDNIAGASLKALVDCGALVDAVTITNCILGKTQLASGALTIKTGGTLIISNCYNTSDWTAAASTATAGITGTLTAYSGASTDLFTSVSVSTVATGTAPYTTTVGNYKIKDAAFAGAKNAGDPRWYYSSANGVRPVLSSVGVSYNGTEILNNNGLAIEVYNVLGGKIATSNKSISTVNFPQGVYIVRAAGIADALKFSK